MSRRFRLVAIDLDGTLLRSDKRISDRTVLAVKRVASRGVRVVLASARPPRAVRGYCMKLGLDGPHVHYNGAVIHDVGHNRGLFHQPLGGRLAAAIIRQVRRVDPEVSVSLEVLDRWYTDGVGHAMEIETSKLFEPDYIGPLHDVLKKPVTKLMLLAPPERLRAIRQTVKRGYVGRVATVMSDAHLLQVLGLGVDKARAVSVLAGWYGVRPREVMAIGDAPNDVGLLRWAGLGVAVGNAWDEAKLAADAVVHSNDEHGVAVALERYVINGDKSRSKRKVVL